VSDHHKGKIVKKLVLTLIVFVGLLGSDNFCGDWQLAVTPRQAIAGASAYYLGGKLHTYYTKFKKNKVRQAALECFYKAKMYMQMFIKNAHVRNQQMNQQTIQIIREALNDALNTTQGIIAAHDYLAQEFLGYTYQMAQNPSQNNLYVLDVFIDRFIAGLERYLPVPMKIRAHLIAIHSILQDQYINTSDKAQLVNWAINGVDELKDTRYVYDVMYRITPFIGPSISDSLLQLKSLLNRPHNNDFAPGMGGSNLAINIIQQIIERWTY